MSEFQEAIKRSPVWVLVGLLGVLGGTFGTYWNEERAIVAHRGFDEGASSVLHVPSDHPDLSNDGKLIHTTGTVSSDEVLRDDVFGVGQKALRLVRSVELYQWEEAKRTENGQTVYAYSKRWSNGILDASGFYEAGHTNPKLLPYEESQRAAVNAHLGGFSIQREAVEKLTKFEALPVLPEMLASAPADARAKLKIEAGALVSGTPGAPDIGDVRVTFQVVRSVQASILGKQISGGIIPATLPPDRSLLLVVQGDVDEKTMLGNTPSEGSRTFMYFRGAALSALALGLWALFAVFEKTLDATRKVRFQGVVRRTFRSLMFGLAVAAGAAAAPWFAYKVWAGSAIAAGALLSWGLAIGLLRTKA
jgi:hypothetical protein